MFDARQMCVKSLAVTNRHPGERFGHIADTRFWKTRKILLPILMHSQRRHPARMSRGQLRVSAHFDPAVKLQSAVRNASGQFAISRLAGPFVQDNRHRLEPFLFPLGDHFGRHRPRFDQDDFERRGFGRAGGG
ncbi:MAG: hypothetical protein DME18_16625, partial [Verrucomicrobia bacterium]